MKGLIFTYLLAFGGAGVALFNPFVGVCIYWIFDLVRPQYMFGWAGTQGSFSEIIAVATIIGWALKGFGNWRFGRGRLLVVLFGAYCVWALLSAIDAPNGEVAMAFMREQAKRLLMFLLAVTLADSSTRVKQLAWVITGSAGYLGFELNMRYFAGFNEVQVFGYGGMDNNSIAISLITCLGPPVFLGFHSRALWQKSLAFGAAALIGHTVLLTFSRGGMLGIIVAGLAALVVMPKRPRYLIPAAVAIAVGLTVAGPELINRFDSSFSGAEDRDSSAQSRVDLWTDCLKVIQKYPILGVGPDHFPLIASEFGWPPGKEAHSLWLQVGAELGIPGVALLLSFYLASAWRMLRMAYGRPTTPEGEWCKHAAMMVVMSFAGFILSAQFVTMEGLETPLYIAVIATSTLRLMTSPAAQFAAQPTLGTGGPQRALPGSGVLRSELSFGRPRR